MANKIFFMGTPQIAAQVLTALLQNSDQFTVVGVACQPDRALDRKGKPIYGPVKQVALANNLPVLQAENINDAIDDVLALQPDLILTCAYGQFISQKLLNQVPYGGVNLHASLLPRWRGGAPIHWAIIHGDAKTGVSLMKLAPKMDAGDYLIQREVEITPKDTMATLYTKLGDVASQMVQEDLQKVFNSEANWIPQDANYVTFAPTIKKADTVINWEQSAEQIARLIRGLNDKPLAIWLYQPDPNSEAIPIKVWEAEVTTRGSFQTGGQIANISPSGLEVTTKDFNLLITKIQLPNKRPMLVRELVNGNHFFKVNR